jgi:oligopeptide/dipeptide ABC transporter ATP-binding protein
MPLLEVDSLTVVYRARRGNIKAVDGVSISLNKGEILGVVGESGSGKSTLGLSLIRQIPPPGIVVSGRILLSGKNILNFPEKEMPLLRGRKIAFIFQDPMASLNPVKNIEAHFVELLRTHERNMSEPDAIRRAKDMLKVLGISPERIHDYPHQFSGGMRQRIMIGLGIALNPDLVIADEPTTALDVIVQAKILDLLKKLRDACGMALILITHDLSIALERSDQIAVMYAGQLVELANSKDIQNSPSHPYTQGLMRSIPNIELADQRLQAISGTPPDLLNLPKGCRFNPRCPYAMVRCYEATPLVQTGDNHWVRCFLYGG